MSALVIEDLGDRVVIHLARPKVRNAIDQQMVDEFHEVCVDLERNPRVALVIGDGGTFASGADISQLRDRRRDDALRGINSAVFDRVHRLPMPVIALLDGHALGGGDPKRAGRRCAARLASRGHLSGGTGDMNKVGRT
jgi:enoyl-CoA hydratase